MQIAAMNPSYLMTDAVPAERVAQEKEILEAQIQNDEKLKNKPAQVIAEKMVAGRVEQVLQGESAWWTRPYVQDGSMTVAQYVAEAVAKELGGDI